MTNSPTTPEPETANPPDKPRNPFQFTIGSLMILTAVVAFFFSISTQVGFVFAAIFLNFAITILALKHQLDWKVITAINALLFMVLATQLPFFTIVGYFHSVFFIVALAHPTQSIGINSINHSLCNIYFLPVFLIQLTGLGGIILVALSFLASIWCSVGLILTGPRINRIYGGVCIAIYPLAIAWFFI